MLLNNHTIVTHVHLPPVKSRHLSHTELFMGYLCSTKPIRYALAVSSAIYIHNYLWWAVSSNHNSIWLKHMVSICGVMTYRHDIVKGSTWKGTYYSIKWCQHKVCCQVHIFKGGSHYLLATSKWTSLKIKRRKTPDSELELRMEWHEHLNTIAHKVTAGRDIVHMEILSNTIGKYVLQKH